MEVLRIFAGGLWIDGAGTEQIRSTADMVDVYIQTKVKPISSAGVAES